MQPLKKEIPSEVRLVVEVDGNPVGFLNLDIHRLWPLISHRKRDTVPVEWIDAAELHSVIRAAVIKRMLSRFETLLYKGLGDEMVKAELAGTIKNGDKVLVDYDPQAKTYKISKQ